MGAGITMGATKREATIEELLSDPLIVPVLQHYGTTAQAVRAIMRDARERLAKARAISETSELPVEDARPNQQSKACQPH